MRTIAKKIWRFIRYIFIRSDFILMIFVYPSALLLKSIRRVGIQNMPNSRRVLLHIGVFPIRSHYTEPLFDTSSLKRPLNQDRELNGIDWNTEDQLKLLSNFQYSEELIHKLNNKQDELAFDLNNPAFQGGDAGFLYNIIRLKKPKRIFEIGSGHSTLLTIKAIKKIRKKILSTIANMCVLNLLKCPG
ncbi:hypothetical protein [Fluviispira sanaruensis]|uniref:Methyltransferase n=1 Tax=Fluviispira sanaruensis TaxID=2493639 RepID=A0A4P2VIF8_FLUSA|nr:hypothetical protein [Fluviispira sanaruensis]BBH52826.1 hypothetical protein JCM31447_12690 [Fluviispira sanaruensis]